MFETGSSKSKFSTHMNSSSDSWLQEVQKLTTVPELELFLLEHGEEVIDMLGQQVDRIEKNIKVMYRRTRLLQLTSQCQLRILTVSSLITLKMDYKPE